MFNKKIIEKFHSIENSNSSKRKVKSMIEVIFTKKFKSNKLYFTGYNHSIINSHLYKCDIEIKNEIKNNPYTIHAESHAMNNLYKSLDKIFDVNDVDTINFYTSTAPCVECSKEILLLKSLFNNDVIFSLIYGEAKQTFKGLHEKTNNALLIPYFVLRSQNIKIYENHSLIVK